MEIVYIPVEVLHKMALWLSQQQNEDGAFIETAEHYYDRSFWVNVVDVMSWMVVNVGFNKCLHFNEKGQQNAYFNFPFLLLFPSARTLPLGPKTLLLPLEIELE